MFIEDDHPWVIAGRENGFPECCIVFFCGEWHALDRDDEGRAQQDVYGDRCVAAYGPIGYIACPGCLEAIECGEMIPPVVKRLPSEIHRYRLAHQRWIGRKLGRLKRANRAARRLMASPRGGMVTPHSASAHRE
jgi:hypothetical protein